jgi:hypothetical protein
VGKKKERSEPFCVQSMAGNFVTQKPVKAGSKVLPSLYYGKVAFGCGFGWQPSPLVGFWLLPKAKAAKSPNQRHPQSKS